MRTRRFSNETAWVQELLHELDALVASPSLQRDHALYRLRDSVRGGVSVIARYQRGQIVGYEHTYVTPRILYYLESPYIGQNGAADVPSDNVLTRRGALVTVLQSSVVVEREWYESKCAQEFAKPGDVGPRLYSKRVVAPGLVERLTIARPWGDRNFSEKDVEALNLFHRHYRFTPISTQERVAALPAREARVLAQILAGASEKLIALELGVSQSLIRKITTSIYRCFDVSSRAELCGLHLSMQRPESAVAQRLPATPPEALRGLTARQREVCAALATGASEAEAAKSLNLSYHTLHDYVKDLYRKLGVSSRAELIARLGRERGLSG